LHSPDYRKKYEIDLKRDFPRIPLYKDFWKYAEAGKKLMDLHLLRDEDWGLGAGLNLTNNEKDILTFLNKIIRNDLQRFTGLERSNEPCSYDLSDYKKLSQRGIIWINKPNAESSGVYSIKYCRRASAEYYPTIFAVPINSQRFFGGVGNADTNIRETKLSDGIGNDTKKNRFSGESTGGTDEISTEEDGELIISPLSPLVTYKPLESLLPKKTYKVSENLIGLKKEEDEKLLKKIKPDIKLKVKDGVIEIDELTTISNIPNEVWEYKLGNRTAVEWVLDQYKPYKSSDETIQTKFNNYDFFEYKEDVIKLLLQVIYVSVETMKIVKTL
jgi:hypothetical protein